MSIVWSILRREIIEEVDTLAYVIHLSSTKM